MYASRSCVRVLVLRASLLGAISALNHRRVHQDAVVYSFGLRTSRTEQGAESWKTSLGPSKSGSASLSLFPFVPTFPFSPIQRLRVLEEQHKKRPQKKRPSASRLTASCSLPPRRSSRGWQRCKKSQAPTRAICPMQVDMVDSHQTRNPLAARVVYLWPATPEE